MPRTAFVALVKRGKAGIWTVVLTDPAIGRQLIAGKNGVSRSGNIDTDFTAFAPRMTRDCREADTEPPSHWTRTRASNSIPFAKPFLPTCSTAACSITSPLPSCVSSLTTSWTSRLGSRKPEFRSRRRGLNENNAPSCSSVGSSEGSFP